ncbi:hypothetical protein H4Q26_004179 [Puccinia striiformis f. sp. tritici PST-130]|nr:hypothetical protein H4Q26_004179 [Puccinia striiformis f. sp. tritici PST-130]
MQRGSWCGKAAAAEISRARQQSGGINGMIKDNNSGINTATAATGGAQRRQHSARYGRGINRRSTAAVAFSMAAAFSTAWRRHQPAEHGSSSMAEHGSSSMAEHGSSSMAEHGGGSIQHGMVEASTSGARRRQHSARHGGGINQRSTAAATFSTAWWRHQPAEHGMAEASTCGARHGGGINQRSTAWQLHQQVEQGGGSMEDGVAATSIYMTVEPTKGEGGVQQ